MAARAGRGNAAPSAAPARRFAAGDLDLDGAVDIVTADPAGRWPLCPQDSGCAQPVAARAVEGTRQQSRRRSARRSRCAPAAWARGSKRRPPRRRCAPADVVFGLGRRAGRRCRARAVAVGHPAGRNHRPAGPQPACSPRPVDRGARSQAVVVPVPVHVERRAVRVRHRLPGRRRDGLLGGARRPQHARPDRVRPHPRRPAPSRTDGRYELRVTNELEEMLYLDRCS